MIPPTPPVDYDYQDHPVILLSQKYAGHNVPSVPFGPSSPVSERREFFGDVQMDRRNSRNDYDSMDDNAVYDGDVDSTRRYHGNQRYNNADNHGIDEVDAKNHPQNVVSLLFICITTECINNNYH